MERASAVKAGAVDIGTNTVRLLIADRRTCGPPSPRPDELDRRVAITTLGQGVDGAGGLSEEAVARAIDVLGSYRTAVEAWDVDVVDPVATSAIRSEARSSPSAPRTSSAPPASSSTPQSSRTLVHRPGAMTVTEIEAIPSLAPARAPVLLGGHIVAARGAPRRPRDPGDDLGSRQSRRCRPLRRSTCCDLSPDPDVFVDFV
jgi:exopolyphosphatase/pppGpp-phosphohydrolase